MPSRTTLPGLQTSFRRRAGLVCLCSLLLLSSAAIRRSIWSFVPQIEYPGENFSPGELHYTELETEAWLALSPILAADRQHGEFKVPRLRASDLSVHDFNHNYLGKRGGRPLVLTDVASEWPAAALWSTQYLQRLFGDARLRVERSGADGAFGWASEDWHSTRLTYAEFSRRSVESCAAADGGRGKLYLATQVPESLMQDIQLGDDQQLKVPTACPVRFSSPTVEEVLVWEAQEGCAPRSLVHNDHADNVLAVLRGCKNVSLWDPYQAPLLYETAGIDRVSPVDVRSPESTDAAGPYPRFARARAVSEQICEGDALFLPALWFHDVQSGAGRTLAVNVWFDMLGMGNELSDDELEMLPTPALRERHDDRAAAGRFDCNPSPSLKGPLDDYVARSKRIRRN